MLQGCGCCIQMCLAFVAKQAARPAQQMLWRFRPHNVAQSDPRSVINTAFHRHQAVQAQTFAESDNFVRADN